MTKFLGYDPGGAKKHGVAVVDIGEDGAIKEPKTQTLHDAEEVCAWLRKNRNGAGAVGIDALLGLSLKGGRACDNALRKKYKAHGNSVIAQNSLYSSMTLNGILVAETARELDLPLRESHPKLLLKGERAKCHPTLLEYAEKITNDDERDALIGAWCAAQWHYGHWTIDLYAEGKEKLFMPAGPAVYPWPADISADA